MLISPAGSATYLEYLMNFMTAGYQDDGCVPGEIRR
jgi:hypothetical protein